MASTVSLADIRAHPDYQKAPPTVQAAWEENYLKKNGAALLHEAASQVGIPKDIAMNMVQLESGWKPQAVSPKGAIGLMQIMPKTAKELGIDPHDPEQNIKGGTRYLGQLLKMFGGNFERAVAAYNAGPGRVQEAIQKYGPEWQKGLPQETRDYMGKVLNIQQQTNLPIEKAIAAYTTPPPQQGSTNQQYRPRGLVSLQPTLARGALPAEGPLPLHIGLPEGLEPESFTGDYSPPTPIREGLRQWFHSPPGQTTLAPNPPPSRDIPYEAMTPEQQQLALEGYAPPQYHQTQGVADWLNAAGHMAGYMLPARFGALRGVSAPKETLPPPRGEGPSETINDMWSGRRKEPSEMGEVSSAEDGTQWTTGKYDVPEQQPQRALSPPQRTLLPPKPKWETPTTQQQWERPQEQIMGYALEGPKSPPLSRGVPTVGERPPPTTTAPRSTILPSAGLPPTPSPKTSFTIATSPSGPPEQQWHKNFKAWLKQTAEKSEQESYFQQVLDDLEERDVNPQSIVETFWRDTYPNLPPDGKRFFQKYLETFQGQKTNTLEELQDFYQPVDAPSTVQYLEGEERGLVSLMEMANRRTLGKSYGASPSPGSTILPRVEEPTLLPEQLTEPPREVLQEKPIFSPAQIKAIQKQLDGKKLTLAEHKSISSAIENKALYDQLPLEWFHKDIRDAIAWKRANPDAEEILTGSQGPFRMAEVLEKELPEGIQPNINRLTEPQIDQLTQIISEKGLQHLRNYSSLYPLSSTASRQEIAKSLKEARRNVAASATSLADSERDMVEGFIHYREGIENAAKRVAAARLLPTPRARLQGGKVPKTPSILPKVADSLKNVVKGKSPLTKEARKTLEKSVKEKGLSDKDLARAYLEKIADGEEKTIAPPKKRK